MGRLTSSILSLLTVGILTFATVPTTSLVALGQTKGQSQFALGLLREADTLSRSFTPEERAELLLRLAQAAAPFDAARANSWSLELFRIATAQLPHGMYRNAMQKDALVTLAQSDPVQAAKLYKQQDVPNTSDDPEMLEDTRSFGTRTLFQGSLGQGRLSGTTHDSEHSRLSGVDWPISLSCNG